MLIFYLCLSFFIARKRQSFDYFGSLNYYNNCNKTHDIALKSTNSIGYTYKYICHPCFVDKKIFFFCSRSTQEDSTCSSCRLCPLNPCQIGWNEYPYKHNSLHN